MWNLALKAGTERKQAERDLMTKLALKTGTGRKQAERDLMTKLALKTGGAHGGGEARLRRAGPGPTRARLHRPGPGPKGPVVRDAQTGPLRRSRARPARPGLARQGPGQHALAAAEDEAAVRSRDARYAVWVRRVDHRCVPLHLCVCVCV